MFFSPLRRRLAERLDALSDRLSEHSKKCDTIVTWLDHLTSVVAESTQLSRDFIRELDQRASHGSQVASTRRLFSSYELSKELGDLRDQHFKEFVYLFLKPFGRTTHMSLWQHELTSLLSKWTLLVPQVAFPFPALDEFIGRGLAVAVHQWWQSFKRLQPEYPRQFDYRPVIHKGLELVAHIRDAAYPGVLFADEPNTPCDNRQHEIVHGPPPVSGKDIRVSYTVFPGFFSFADRQIVDKARVTTKDMSRLGV